MSNAEKDKFLFYENDFRLSSDYSDLDEQPLFFNLDTVSGPYLYFRREFFETLGGKEGVKELSDEFFGRQEYISISEEGDWLSLCFATHTEETIKPFMLHVLNTRNQLKIGFLSEVINESAGCIESLLANEDITELTTYLSEAIDYIMAIGQSIARPALPKPTYNKSYDELIDALPEIYEQGILKGVINEILQRLTIDRLRYYGLYIDSDCTPAMYDTINKIITNPFGRAA